MPVIKRLLDYLESKVGPADRIREKLSDRQWVTTAASLLVVGASLGAIIYHFTIGAGPRKTDAQLVYFDLEAQAIRLVEHTYPNPPVSPLTDDRQVFLAQVYTCVDGPVGKVEDGMTLKDLADAGMFIASLQQIDPNVTGEAASLGKGLSYRTLENERWHRIGDKGYAAIQRQLYERCANPRVCWP